MRRLPTVHEHQLRHLGPPGSSPISPKPSNYRGDLWPPRRRVGENGHLTTPSIKGRMD